MSTGNRFWEQQLERILALWTRPGSERAADRHALAPWIADELDPRDLAAGVGTIAEIVAISEGEERARVDFLDTEGVVRRALFRRREGDAWRLRALRGQCAACAGTGEDRADPCRFCGGSGWRRGA